MAYQLWGFDVTEGKSVCLVIIRGQIQYLLALATPEQMWSL